MQLFDWIYIGEVGAHDGDWEHVTLRLTPDARQVLGIYYSAHRYLLATPGRTSGRTQQPFGLILLKLACYIILDSEAESAVGQLPLTRPIDLMVLAPVKLQSYS